MNNRVALLAVMIVLSITIAFSQQIRVIPQPNDITYQEASFVMDGDVVIVAGDEVEAAGLLKEYLAREYSIETSISLKKSKKMIRFKEDKTLGKEAYELAVDNKEIQITASGSTGWFYAVQTLKQIFPVSSDAIRETSSFEVPGLSISDSPRFAWRAFMLDEARFFKGKEQVKMLLDEMAGLKMNVFHWHLVDDQGWRIEIKKYPKLTEIGSKRKSTQVGPLKWKSPIQSAEPHEGYYTQEEIKEIIDYAAERHITIVPEIEMPGHSSAAIASYSWLGTAKEEIEVPIRFGVSKDVYDVSDPKVYQFLTDVLDEVMALFPSKVIHIGGDEVKYDRWKNSSSVQAYMKENQLATPADLQVYFTNSISQYLQGKGRRMMGWNEIMGHNLHEYQDQEDTKTDQKLADETVVHFWKGDVKLATHAATNGYDIVNSLHSETYLDYPYTSIPLSRAYAFDPVPKDLDPQYHTNVIGTGCQMWGEWIPTDGQMHFMVFPRIAAYAEVGWTQLESKDFDAFKVGLQRLQDKWKAQEIYYAESEYSEPE